MLTNVSRRSRDLAQTLLAKTRFGIFAFLCGYSGSVLPLRLCVSFSFLRVLCVFVVNCFPISCRLVPLKLPGTSMTKPRVQGTGS